MLFQELQCGFVDYLLRSQPFQEEFYRYGKGIVADLWSTGWDEMKNILLAIPNNSEQVRIAEFLDRETGKIDALVKEQRRLIELLKEKRQAVISHAVTKGLDPNAPMKDSGIEWIGPMPQRWRVGKCGFYLRVLSGFAFPSADFTQDEADVKLLRGINVGVGALRWEQTVYWRRVPNDGLDDYVLKTGDLVLGMDRPIINEGIRAARVSEGDLSCLLLQRVAALRIGPLLTLIYFLAILSSDMFEAHFAPETTGVSVPHMSPEQIKDFLIPVPSITEQQAIVTFIGSQTEKCNTLVAKAEQAITLLQEHRSALISAAVTGKIDVRDYNPAQAEPTGEAHARA